MEGRQRKGKQVKNIKGKGSQCIKFYSTFTNTIYDVLNSRGWREVDSETEVSEECKYIYLLK